MKRRPEAGTSRMVNDQRLLQGLPEVDSRPRKILVNETTAKKSGGDESQRRATGDEGKTTSVHSKVGRVT